MRTLKIERRVSFRFLPRLFTTTFFCAQFSTLSFSSSGNARHVQPSHLFRFMCDPSLSFFLLPLPFSIFLSLSLLRNEIKVKKTMIFEHSLFFFKNSKVKKRNIFDKSLMLDFEIHYLNVCWTISFCRSNVEHVLTVRSFNEDFTASPL